jgi:hypothetical protein
VCFALKQIQPVASWCARSLFSRQGPKHEQAEKGYFRQLTDKTILPDATYKHEESEEVSTILNRIDMFNTTTTNTISGTLKASIPEIWELSNTVTHAIAQQVGTSNGITWGRKVTVSNADTFTAKAEPRVLERRWHYINTHAALTVRISCSGYGYIDVLVPYSYRSGAELVCTDKEQPATGTAAPRA